MGPDDDPSPLDRVAYLARAESRVRILEALLESGSATQRDLRARLDASRTTVARSLRSLEETGWVERDARTYRLTPAGRLVADSFLDLVDTVELTEGLSAFLEWFPRSELPFELDRLADAEITTSDAGDPYAPARKQSEILRTADRMRLFLPSIDMEGTKLITERVTEGGLEAETVIAPGLEATVESDDFGPLLREKVATGRSDVYVAESDLGFYLGLADDGTVQIGVEDGDGLPRALVETADARVREWAEETYERYRADARPKPAEEF
ncbi:helix-turn-helix transcriptional regulator [Halostella litorea]|uniref:helix-turn-helix transcriptional regulator n=1 Tax=Halostella litorea TaxID=2528831 RepID=UPI001091B7EA|nr:winged helix-turn-helix transcriptional regulator [Halostella litorea]